MLMTCHHRDIVIGSGCSFVGDGQCCKRNLAAMDVLREALVMFWLVLVFEFAKEGEFTRFRF